MAATGSSIVAAFDYVWDRFTARLAGIGDDELLWEPVAGCWTVRPDGAGGWRVDGAAAGVAEPQPAPVTTIAWRVAHVAVSALGGFTERLFGTRDAAVMVVGDAVVLPGLLAAAYGGWRHGLVGLEAAAWDRALGPAWGPYAEASVLDLALHVFDEVVHHGGEIGVLRDLYAHRGTWLG